MTPDTTALIGSTLFTLVVLGGAMTCWLHCVRRYRSELSERGELLLRFFVPTFALLAASPLFDLIVMYAGGPFPTIGLPGVVVGTAGAVVAGGYVYADIRSSESGPPDFDGNESAV